MRLLIKEKVFTFGDKFTVTDECGNDRYLVEGEIFSWGKKLHVCTPAGREVAYVEQQVFSFKPRYQVFVEGTLIGEVVREFSFFRPRYTVVGANWDVEGELWTHDYTVSRDGETIVTISKEWMTFGDTYVLDVRNPEDEICALALVLAIDCAMEQDRS